MATYFVNQKKHNGATDAWDNNCHVKTSENDQAALCQAMHQFHAFMSTYGYGFGENIDYTSCSVEATDGRIVKSEVDDRRPAPEPAAE